MPRSGQRPWWPALDEIERLSKRYELLRGLLTDTIHGLRKQPEFSREAAAELLERELREIENGTWDEDRA